MGLALLQLTYTLVDFPLGDVLQRYPGNLTPESPQVRSYANNARATHALCIIVDVIHPDEATMHADDTLVEFALFLTVAHEHRVLHAINAMANIAFPSLCRLGIACHAYVLRHPGRDKS